MCITYKVNKNVYLQTNLWLSDPMMKTGDRYEMEIRGCSIWATEVSDGAFVV